jgi:hypothetical protein
LKLCYNIVAIFFKLFVSFIFEFFNSGIQLSTTVCVFLTAAVIGGIGHMSGLIAVELFVGLADNLARLCVQRGMTVLLGITFVPHSEQSKGDSS